MVRLANQKQIMGAIVCSAADTSALEKQTIVNTRANKLRHYFDNPVLTDRRVRSESPPSRPKHKENYKVVRVGFGSIVHERIYQDELSAPSINPADKTVGSIWNRRPVSWPTRFKADLKAEDESSLMPSDPNTRNQLARFSMSRRFLAKSIVGDDFLSRAIVKFQPKNPCRLEVGSLACTDCNAP